MGIIYRLSINNYVWPILKAEAAAPLALKMSDRCIDVEKSNSPSGTLEILQKDKSLYFIASALRVRVPGFHRSILVHYIDMSQWIVQPPVHLGPKPPT